MKYKYFISNVITTYNFNFTVFIIFSANPYLFWKV